MLDLASLKFPGQMPFLGGLFMLVAVFYIIDIGRQGYLSGIFTLFVQRLKTYKFLFIGILILALFEIFFIDLPVSQFCKNGFNQNLYSLLDFCNQMGEGWFLGGVLIAGIIITEFFKKAYISKVFKTSFAALVFAGLLNGILKLIFNRQRPGIAMNPWHFFHFFQTGASDFSQLVYASNSMPSGHTITVFATIIPLFLHFKNKVARVFLVFFALIICIARIYTLNHWLSDVTIATALGIAIGISAYRANNLRLIK